MRTEATTAMERTCPAVRAVFRTSRRSSGGKRVADRIDGLRERLERALKAGGKSVARLGRADTSVTFKIRGAEDDSVTLLLDRQPPEVVNGGEPAEITIELDSEQAEKFGNGELVLSNSLLQGHADASGPVRKYLSYDPILRALLSRVKDADE